MFKIIFHHFIRESDYNHPKEARWIEDQTQSMIMKVHANLEGGGQDKVDSNLERKDTLKFSAKMVSALQDRISIINVDSLLMWTNGKKFTEDFD